MIEPSIKFQVGSIQDEASTAHEYRHRMKRVIAGLLAHYRDSLKARIATPIHLDRSIPYLSKSARGEALERGSARQPAVASNPAHARVLRNEVQFVPALSGGCTQRLSE